METFIKTVRNIHGVKTPDAYEARLREEIARKPDWMGVDVHESTEPVVAYISDNRWVIDCECGAGNMVNPTWAVACCFACGAIHRAITVPEAAIVEQIEQVLLARPKSATRNWLPQQGEDVVALVKENQAHGVAVPADVLEAVASTIDLVEKSDVKP